jgi:D-glycero-D-manno-heptose 1,7-bisphosphate phosphatase
MGITRAAVFLDRDGVINRPAIRGGRPYPPADEAALEVLPGVAESLTRLRAAGFRLIVVTNQPDVARGTQTRDVVDRMHARLASLLPLDDIRVCPHDDDDRCECRKPLPGLLEAAAREHGLSLGDSFMVGDRWRDIEAGSRAGCTTVFIDWGYDEPRPEHPDAVVRSLPEAADWILARVAEARA